MKKIMSKAGYVVYKATASDTEKLGGRGICDFCGKRSPDGYFIPVINSYHCPECYKDWDESSRMYPEDLHIEEKRIAYYEAVFG